MELKDFIGKVVISTYNGDRFTLYEITSPVIRVLSVEKNKYGTHSCYSWETINGDPISTGKLIFEDPSLTEPFKKAYNAYTRTEDAYWESYGYWMRKS